MAPTTVQMGKWAGPFGKAYTDRNAASLNEMEELSRKRLGWARTELNERFLRRLDRRSRILEAGCNIGNQLLCLQRMGFQDLWGVELQRYAVENAKARTHGIGLVQASVLEIPFQAGSFDLVFTSAVLIHVAPPDIRRALSEIRRCSRRWIWGYEYFSEGYEPVPYRGHRDLLWKTDFARLYQESFPDLSLVKEEKYRYTDNDNVDAMFLLRKEELHG